MKRINVPFKLIKKSKLEVLNKTVELKEKSIQVATDLIQEIEKGNLEIEIKDTDHDQLSLSIVSMRDQMKKIAIEEKERAWLTEGLAKFVDILRTNNEDLKELADNIISNLVKYLKANQGALFILNIDQNEHFLELTSCFAYNRKKFMEKKIGLGEGLVGQAYLEKDTIYLKEIPDSYVNISSGLGEARPKNVLIVPLQINGEVYGVVELASFNTIPPYQISFVERLGESIASTISSTRVNQRTKILLQEAQSQTEELRSQEEEVRQNMEELSATQEEMQRILKEVQGNEAFMNDLMNATNDSIVTVDTDYKVISANKTTINTYKASGMEIEKGFDIFKIFPSDQRAKYKGYYDRALGGEYFEVTENYQLGGKNQYFAVTYSPLRNEKGEIRGASAFSKDITEAVLSKLKSEELLKEAIIQSEELKAQEEEMRQSMEELSATQEEIERVLAEVKKNEAFITSVMDATNDSIITIDTDYKIISCNKSTVDTYKTLGLEVGKGFDIFKLFTEDQKPKYKSYYDRVFNGEYFEVTASYQFGGNEQHFAVTYSPLRNDKNEIIGAAAFGKDVTETIAAKHKAEELLIESQQQAEELKAQEEELRQNMEEVSATQEEMERHLNKVLENEHVLTELLDVASDLIVTLDKNFHILSFNKTFAAFFNAKKIAVGKGYDMMKLFSPAMQNQKRILYKRVFSGETVDLVDHLNSVGLDNYFQVKHSPLFNKKGDIVAISFSAKDITETTKLRKELSDFKKGR